MTRAHGSARIQPSIAGRVKGGARLRLPGLECGPFSPTVVGVSTVAPLRDISGYLSVPCAVRTPGTELSISADPMWGRTLAGVTAADSECPVLVVSARNEWTTDGTTVSLLGTAVVIDGARRAEALLRSCPEIRVPLLALFGLAAEEELAIRHSLSPVTAAPADPAMKFETDTPRLAIGDRWITMTVMSEPFVVRTARGYAPAVLVQRAGVLHPEHILVGARSLAEGLESQRNREGALVGVALRTRKTATAATAPYEVSPP